MRERLLPYGLLFILLLAMLPLKAQLDFGLGPRAHDADYYYGIARYVSEGEGLQSNLSLYLQGFKHFPHRVTQSPVWPLTLGAAGAAIGIERAAVVLPNALYLLDLVLLYFLGLRLWRAVAGKRAGLLFREGRIPDFGHVAVFVLATNFIFFRFSSVPNNEPLAFAFLFGALLSVDRAARGRSVTWAAGAGLLAGLALLTRVQCIPAVVAVPLALAAIGLRDPSSRTLAPAALLAALLPALPWALYLATWVDPLGLQAVLGMETQRETPALGVQSHTVVLPTLWATIADRLSGLRVAFAPTSNRSYVHHYNALAYLVPLALVPLALSLVPRALALTRLAPTGGKRVASPTLRFGPDAALPLAMGMLGLGMLLPVHGSHMVFSKEWLFGFRHGLPLIFLILPALAYLDTHASRVWRVTAALLLAAGVAMHVADMRSLLSEKFRSGITPVEQELVRWLDAQSPLPSVVTTKPWELGTYSRSGYHWVLCAHAPKTALQLLRDAGADYVVIYPSDRSCRFLAALRAPAIEVVKSFGQGREALYVLAPARSEGAASDPSSSEPPGEAR